MDLEYLKILIAVVVATGGWLVTFLLAERGRKKSRERELEQSKENAEKDRRRLERHWKIERLDQQIKYLYGPAYAQLQSSEAAWAMFWHIHAPEHGYRSFFIEGVPNTESELKTWRTWVTSVFQPSNRAIVRLIIDNAHLIEFEDGLGEKAYRSEDDVMPNEFRLFLAHSQTYDAVIAQWQAQDFQQHTTGVNFPENFQKSVVQTYLKLLKRRKELMETVQ